MCGFCLIFILFYFIYFIIIIIILFIYCFSTVSFVHLWCFLFFLVSPLFVIASLIYLLAFVVSNFFCFLFFG